MFPVVWVAVWAKPDVFWCEWGFFSFSDHYTRTPLIQTVDVHWCQCRQIHPVKSSTSLPLSWVSWHRWLNSHSMGLAYSERQSRPLPYVSNLVCSFLRPDLRNNAFFGSILISRAWVCSAFVCTARTHTHWTMEDEPFELLFGGL